MYVRKVEIDNVRGFRELSLNFARPDDAGYAGWTVIAGRNGAGKTTLLQAIALGLTGGDSGQAIADDGEGWVRSAARHSKVRYELIRSDDDRVGALEYSGNDTEFEQQWSAWHSATELIFSWTWQEPPRAGIHRSYPYLEVDGDIDESMLQERLRSGSNEGWFAAGYGAFRHRFGEASKLAEGARSPRRRAFETLFREDVGLVACTAWLRDVHFRAIDKRDEALAVLRDGALRLLNDGLLPDAVELTRVNSDGLWARQHGEEKLLDRLSSGFRIVAALVLDIVAQMHRAFGELHFEERVDPQSGARHPVLTHSGVVLLDEAEEHLHPEWQQQLGFWLKKHFPHVQFLVTTHSPFVCQAADLIVRVHPDGGGAWTASRASEKTHVAVVNGTLDDVALSDLFGVRNVYTERAEALRDEVAELEVMVLRGEASPEEKARFHELAAKLPSDDTSVIEQSLRKLVKLQ